MYDECSVKYPFNDDLKCNLCTSKRKTLLILRENNSVTK